MHIFTSLRLPLSTRSSPIHYTGDSFDDSARQLLIHKIFR
jgi:hypothetical protein